MTGSISARTPQTTVVEPIRTSDEPFVCVGERMLRFMGRDWVGVRPDGRVGGDWDRWARSRAEGEMSGIVDGGTGV